MNIFNPEHDLCIANGDANFVPPASALEFGKDCAGLTRWIDQSSDNEVVPWGWDAVLKRRLQKEGVPGSMLPSDAAIAEIRRLSHRGNAVSASIYVNDFQANADARLLKYLRPLSYVWEISDVNALTPAVEEFGDAVLKAPLSGSGKGLRWARRNELSASDLGWSRNVIAKQGSLMVEKRLEIVQDFAMLFHVGRSEVSFEGYSLFFNDNGIYKGNVLASDAHIFSRISCYVPNELIINVKAALKKYLECEFMGKYTGYVGADMFIYEEAGEYRLAPVGELNVRMTMGLLARRLYDRYLYGNPQQIKLLHPGASELPASDMKPADQIPDLDGQYAMCVEYSPVPGKLYSEKEEYLETLTGITPASRYAVVVRRADVSR